MIKAYINGSGRGGFRNKRLFLAGISMMGSKGISVLVALVSVPLTFSYLTAERFGIMMTIVSLVTTINFMDFGLGFGLQNRWAEISEDKTGESIRYAVSSVFFFLILISIILIVVSLFFYFLVDISFVFNFKNPKELLKVEINNSALVLFLSTALAIPFTIVQKIQNGKQESYKVNIWTMVSSITSLLLLVIFTSSKFSIPYIVFALYGVNSIFIILNFVSEFYIKRHPIRLSFNYARFSHIKKYAKDGLAFMLNQLSTVVINTSNNLFLAYYHNPALIAVFNIGIRLISFFSLPIESISPYFMPAINDAFVSNDNKWLKKIFKRYLLFLISYSILSAALFLTFGNDLIHAWIDNNVVFNFVTLVCLAVYGVVINFTFFASSAIMTSRFIYVSFYLYPFAVILITLVRFQFVPEFGIIGLLMPQIILQTILYILPIFLILRRSKLL